MQKYSEPENIDLVAMGIQLRERMKAKGIGVTELQRLTKTSYRSTVYHWLQGHVAPRLDTLVVLADVFECTVDDLIVRKVK